MQPTGFSAGDEPPFELTVSGTGYIFAKSTYDWAELQWTDAEVVDDGTGALENTSTIAYVLMGTYDASGDSIVLEFACGDVVMNVCDLAQPE